MSAKQGKEGYALFEHEFRELVQYADTPYIRSGNEEECPGNDREVVA